MHLYTFKLGSRHALFLGHIQEQMFVWLIGLKNVYALDCLWKIHDYHSSIKFVVNQSLQYMIIDFQHHIPINHRLVLFL